MTRPQASKPAFSHPSRVAYGEQFNATAGIWTGGYAARRARPAAEPGCGCILWPRVGLPGRGANSGHILPQRRPCRLRGCLCDRGGNGTGRVNAAPPAPPPPPQPTTKLLSQNFEGHARYGRDQPYPRRRRGFRRGGLLVSYWGVNCLPAAGRLLACCSSSLRLFILPSPAQPVERSHSTSRHPAALKRRPAGGCLCLSLSR